VHAASNLIEEQFEDREWTEASDRDAAIGAHATGLLLRALESRTSEASFREGTPNLKDKPVTDLATADILFEFLKEHPKSSREVRVRLGNVGMHPVRVLKMDPEVEAIAGTHPIVGEIWERCDGDLTVLQLAGAISAGLDTALRALYGMMLIGTVETISRKARSKRKVEDVPVTRNELMMRLDKAVDANHYGVLELNAQADEDEIRSSYYLLARRYHPDRFRAGEMVDLLPRIEAFFSQVTEAYNTLADEELRKDYDEAMLSKDERADEEPVHDTSHLARQNYVAAKELVKRKQFRQAIKFLENAIELEENVPEYHVEYGSLIGLNPVRREEAEEHLRHGLQLDPTVLDGHTALADLLVKRDKPTNAIQVLMEGLKWFPDHPELKSRLKELGAGEGRGLFGR
jgi:curved DNA-binding protein CbpA